MMRTKWMKFTSLATLSLATVLGCSDHGTAPQLAPGGRSDLEATAAVKSYKLIREDSNEDKTNTTFGIFSPEWPAALHAGGHKLSIPAGAVDRPTLWRMTVRSDGYVLAELRAFQQDANGAYTVDVGARGFKVPVTLTLSYKGATGYSSPSQLKTLWVKPDGGYEPATNHEMLPGHKLSAKLHHFSDYAIGFPNVLDAEVSVGGDDGLGVDISLF